MPYTSVAKVVLGPLLYLQGRRVRSSVLRMPEATGDRDGYIAHKACDKPLNLLFIGDSTMAGVGAKSQETALGILTSREVSALLSRSVRWQLIAKSGVKTSQVLALIEEAKPLDADVLITALGGNDVLAQTKPRKFVQAYEGLVTALLPKDRPGITVISGLPPLHITPAIPQPLRWFFGICAHRLDRVLRKWIRRTSGVSYLSLQWAADRTRLATDQFHPGEGLYREWAHRIARKVVQEINALELTTKNQSVLACR